MTLDSSLHKRLCKIKANDLHRELRTMHTAPQPRMIVDGKKQIVFSSNNYLGLANNREMISEAEKVLQEFGVGSSGSRLTTGNSTWHEKLEKRIAIFKQTEAALLFSSGYLANIGVLSALPEKGDLILSDELNHASIIDGCRLSQADTVIYNHIDMADLEEKLKKAASYKRCFIVTDGVFGMDGTIAPLDEIISLAKTYQAYVVVDDAHATGVLGENGRGTGEYFDVSPDILIGTLSKAVGTEGAFVAGSKILIDFLLNNARTFIFQTSIPPSSCAASYKALEIIEQSKEKRHLLYSNVEKIKKGLTHLGFTVYGQNTPIIAVLIKDTKQAILFAKRLQEVGIYAPAIRPPTVPVGKSRIRLTVTSDHDSEEIDALLKAFQLIGNEMNIIKDSVLGGANK